MADAVARARKSWSVAAFTLLQLLVCIAIIAVVVGLSMASFQSMKARSDSARCITNMRQLSLIILRYSAENNGDLLPARVWNGERPPAGSPTGARIWSLFLEDKGYLPRNEYYDTAKGILRSKSIMRCPARDLEPAAIDKLHYGMYLSKDYYQGESLSKLFAVETPSRTMMLGEVHKHYMIATNMIGTQYIPFPHKDGNNVVFMDGHAETTPSPWKVPKAGDSYPFY